MCNWYGGADVEALWDTGAQVSLVDKDWLADSYPDAEVDSLETFLKGDNLHLFSANSRKISVCGVATLNVEIAGFPVQVPFIVSDDPVSQPIIGYNVIKHLVFEGGDEPEKLLKLSFPGIVERNLAAVVNIIREEKVKEDFVVTTKKTVIPANSRCKIKCRTKYRASELEESVVFTPNPIDSELEMESVVTTVKLGRGHTQIVVRNPTNFPVILDKSIVLGSIESISAVIPLMPGNSNDEGTSVSESKETGAAEVGMVEVGGEESGGGPRACEGHLADGHLWLPPVDLTHLPPDKKEMVERVLREEADVFCRDGMLHGYVPERNWYVRWFCGRLH